MDPFRYPLPTRSIYPDDITRSLQDRLGWMQQSLARSTEWLKAQRSTVDPQAAMDIICGLDGDSVPDPQMSDVRSAEIKRSLLELIAELGNLRAEGQVKTDNKSLFDQSAILDKTCKSWFTMIRGKRKARAAIAYAAVLGTGGLGLEWDPKYWGPKRGDNNLRPMGPHQMLPDGLPPDGNFQRAYVVHLVEEVPIHDARSRFPLLAKYIQPDRGMPSGWAQRMASFERWLSPVFNAFGIRGDKAANNNSNYPTVDIISSYVMDDSINTTNEPIVTGKVGTTWEHVAVPFGSDIPTSVYRDGKPIMRKATREDAMLYPNRRRVVWCSTAILEDDHSPWWHGKVPFVRFKIEDWPWEPNGVSPMKDAVPLQRSQTRMMRAVENATLARLNPGLFYDESALADAAAEEINPMIPGQRIKANLQMGGDIVKAIVPPEYYEVPSVAPDWIQKLDDRIKRLLYVQDVNALTKGRQLPGGDALDKMIELAGPCVRDMLEAIEDSMSDLGGMLIYNVFQFYGVDRRMQMLGEDGVTKADWDFEPGKLVPSHMPEEDPDQGPSQLSQLERAKIHADKFFFYVTPGSLHDLSRTTMKLMVLQAIKAGLKLDQWTIAKIFGVPYYGPEPEGTQTVIERVQAERRIEMEMQAEAQFVAAQRMAGAPGQEGAGETGPGAGRPPTNAAPPVVQQKDGGTRSTVSTSR